MSKGLLSQNQVTKILEYQCRLPPGQYMPFTQIAMDFGYLEEDQLKAVLGTSYAQAQDPVGQILVQQGLVSLEQLKQALEVLNTFPRSHVVDILIDMGFTSLAEVSQAISKHQLTQIKRLQSLSPVYDGPVEPVSEASTKQNAEESSVVEPVPESAPAAEQVAVHLPLGRQLIARGYLSEDELRDAIEYQQRLPKVMYKPLGEILVSLGYINEEQLQEILLMQSEQQQPRPKMGEILIRSGLIEEWQLSHALSLQFSAEHAQKKLGTLLVELGYASRDEIEGALSRFYQKQQPASAGHADLTPPPRVSRPAASKSSNPAFLPPASASPAHLPIGQMLMAKGYITEPQLNDALASQQKQSAADYMPLGDILVLKGYLTEAQLQEALSEQPDFVREPLGQILIQQGLIEEWQLAHALCIQFETPEEGRQNLGTILTTLGYVSQPEIEAAILTHFRRR
ncbi:MAG: hypothetical protein IGS03_14830 [Candidatus Sericytochromatia bacterium]|nr:hypothetical protein [Candidatus Sericytochromatia bacterium]